MLAGHLAWLLELGAVPREGVYDSEPAIGRRRGDRVEFTRRCAAGRPTGWQKTAPRCCRCRRRCPDVAWRHSVRLGRDHYVRAATNDYSVHPKRSAVAWTSAWKDRDLGRVPTDDPQ